MTEKDLWEWYLCRSFPTVAELIAAYDSGVVEHGIDLSDQLTLWEQ